MPRPRRSRRFERLGDLRAERLGLSARRCRELELVLAWRRIAGTGPGAWARPVRVRRGVLELELLTADETRRRAVLESLPELLPALAAALPKQGLKQIRVVASEHGILPEAIDAPEAARVERSAGAATGRGTLQDLMERYLVRARGGGRQV